MKCSHLGQNDSSNFRCEPLLIMDGRYAEIHTDFKGLPQFADLFSGPSHTIFLLLGNTVGNLSEERSTLELIRQVMPPASRLYIELQLKKNTRPTDRAVREFAITMKAFFGGPFLALGCDRGAFEVIIEAEDAQHYSGGTVAEKVYCEFSRRVQLHHPRFKRKVVINKGTRIAVLESRKYTVSDAHGLLNDAGFELIDSVPRDDDEEADFGYFVVRRADAHRQCHQPDKASVPSGKTRTAKNRPKFQGAWLFYQSVAS